MNIQDSLEILLRWLEDNVEMETDILFSDNVDSTAMIPAVQAAIALAENAKHGTANADEPVSVLDNDCLTTSGIDDQGNSIDGGKALQIADHERKLVAVTHGQVIKEALNATSDFLDTDCVMDRLGISYEDASFVLPARWNCIMRLSSGLKIEFALSKSNFLKIVKRLK
ncbi:hypothetical protein [Klebsiella pneumoniae]|uniref:hypothetical protein n=1 Tax=Klebsiella pneumoniae TaxID=573 RepID=UPI002867D127|nr:hypothetical protein [Klebsiella pneumoniae]WMW82618.1 hypothetical protein RG050_00615 [Klebsiella pneumoniae]